MKRALILALLIVGCSSPRPTNKRADALMTGDETATKAAEATRAAEASGNSGVLIDSSNRAATNSAEPTTQPMSQPSETPPAEPSVVAIEFVQGTPTMSGEPVVDLDAVFASAVADDPEVQLRITSSEDVPHAKVVEVTDKAKAAGVKRVMVTIKVTHDDKSPSPSK